MDDDAELLDLIVKRIRENANDFCEMALTTGKGHVERVTVSFRCKDGSKFAIGRSAIRRVKTDG